MRAEELTRCVEEIANQVHDPCSMAQGVPTGLTDMGLVHTIDVASSPRGWEVQLRLRLTAPGCMYALYFERELRKKIESIDDVACLSLTWHDEYDWTPAAMAPEARAKLARQRVALSREE